MATLSIRSLCKDYGGVVAVREVSLDVAEGHLVALLGPSGCGKTSTLKMIAGLEDVTSGELVFDGQVMNDIPTEQRDVAMVFEDYSLYPRMDVSQNIMFPLKIRGLPPSERQRRLEEMLEILELGDVARAHVQELSGGQQQRVAIARALVREPSILLFDEPLSHLDAELKVRLRNQIRWLQQRKGVTSVLVTHDQAEALALADAVAVMNLGELRQFGTPEEVYRHPRDMFVAGFIGEPPMNFIMCHLEVSGPRVTVRGEGLLTTLPQALSAALLSLDLDLSRAYVLGIRPEDLFISSSEADTKWGHGEVFFSEWRGDYQVVLLSRPGRRGHWLTLLAQEELTLSTGQPVGVAANPARAHLFDSETQHNVFREHRQQPTQEQIASAGSDVKAGRTSA